MWNKLNQATNIQRKRISTIELNQLCHVSASWDRKRMWDWHQIKLSIIYGLDMLWKKYKNYSTISTWIITIITHRPIVEPMKSTKMVTSKMLENTLVILEIRWERKITVFQSRKLFFHFKILLNCFKRECEEMNSVNSLEILASHWPVFAIWFIDRRLALTSLVNENANRKLPSVNDITQVTKRSTQKVEAVCIPTAAKYPNGFFQSNGNLQYGNYILAY